MKYTSRNLYNQKLYDRGSGSLRVRLRYKSNALSMSPPGGPLRSILQRKRISAFRRTA